MQNVRTTLVMIDIGIIRSHARRTCLRLKATLILVMMCFVREQKKDMSDTETTKVLDQCPDENRTESRGRTCTGLAYLRKLQTWWAKINKMWVQFENDMFDDEDKVTCSREFCIASKVLSLLCV